MSFHTIILVGNLGKEPEMRYTPSGQAVTSFSVASSRSWVGADGAKHEETIWFRISAWGKSAETCNTYLHKGSKVLVEGRLQHNENGSPRTFTRQDGTTGASFEVTASTVRFLSTKAESGSGEETAETNGVDEDNIPF